MTYDPTVLLFDSGKLFEFFDEIELLVLEKDSGKLLSSGVFEYETDDRHLEFYSVTFPFVNQDFPRSAINLTVACNDQSSIHVMLNNQIYCTDNYLVEMLQKNIDATIDVYSNYISVSYLVCEKDSDYISEELADKIIQVSNDMANAVIGYAKQN
jgi:hypothetical protein